MFDPERRIDVEWDSAGTDQAPYIVRLTMQVEDRKGMLAEISAKISDINTNITNMEARTGEDQQARIDMTVEIRDMKHLEKVIKSIKGVQGVLGVERTAGRNSKLKIKQRRPERLARDTAIASISIFTSRGSLATCTVARAGGGSTM